MKNLALLVAASVALAACKTSPPLEVVCPTSAGDPVSWCTLNQAPYVVKATVAAWGTSTRVLDLTGFHDIPFTPVSLEIDAVAGPLSRGNLTGRLDVLMRGCIDEAGTTIDGPLSTEAGKAHGYFFIAEADGYAVVLPQGYFRFEGSQLLNSGAALQGMTEAEVRSQLNGAVVTDPRCSSPDSGT
jgi:hypothetical protein